MVYTVHCTVHCTLYSPRTSQIVYLCLQVCTYCNTAHLTVCTHLCVRVVHLEIRHNDRDGQRHREHTAQRAQSTHKHAQVGLGHHVPVAHRRHRDQGPPQPQRNRVEVVVRIGLDALRIVDQAGKDDDAEHQEEDQEHQFFGGGAEGLEEDLEAGGVAGQLEQPEDADDGEELEDVGILQVGGHLSKHQVYVETERGRCIEANTFLV